MKIEEFIEKGYFLKELPKCFSTKQYSEKVTLIFKNWKEKYETLNKSTKKMYSKSSCIKFSYPKKEFNRRYLSIPNPLHYSELAFEIVENWEEILEKFENNKMSESLPVIDSIRKVRAITTKSKSFLSFQEKKIELSFDCIYELKVDISKFYDSIYTHTVAWALHGKEEARTKMYSDNLLGNKIDKKIRNCQEGHSIGIPIGPDSSFLVSELILNVIDKKISLKGCRYADDIYLYSNDKIELQKSLKKLREQLAEYKLSLNESKVEIKKFPFKIDEGWESELEKIIRQFSEKESQQKKAIKNFFNFVFIEMEKSKKDQILKYAHYKLLKVEIFKGNWENFENLLLKSMLLCPEIIEKSIEILKKHEEYVSKNKLGILINRIIQINSDFGNDYEIIWALWAAKELNIKIKFCNIKKIIETASSITCVLAIGIYKDGLVKEVKGKEFELIERIKNRIKNKNFYSDEWILYYELAKKNWFSDLQEFIKKDLFMELLLNNNIEFFSFENITVAKNKNEIEIIEQFDGEVSMFD